MNTETALHPFYQTLGPGPYRWVGCYDMVEAMNPNSAANFGNMRGWLADAPKLKAGLGTCAHCGMAIMQVCIVQTGNGDLYGVGCDCVEKCSTGGIWKGVKAAIALRRKKKNQARREAVRQAKWEAERPERERRIAEQQAAHAVELAKRKAETLGRFDQFGHVLEALVGSRFLMWRDDYAAEQPHTYGKEWAQFSPPCDMSSFYESLAIQLIQQGSLSPRQAEYAAKAVFGRRSKGNEAAFEDMVAKLTNA